MSSCLTGLCCSLSCLFFFFNDTATTEIYTLSLHDALPIFCPRGVERDRRLRRDPLPDRDVAVFQSRLAGARRTRREPGGSEDRKSTRLNSSHGYISYAVFCLKKKKSNVCLTLAGPPERCRR